LSIGITIQLGSIANYTVLGYSDCVMLFYLKIMYYNRDMKASNLL